MKPRAPSRREVLTGAAGVAAASIAGAPVSAQVPELSNLTLKKASDLLRRKSVSPVDLTEACLKRIEQLNPVVNAFITVTAEQALAAAREMAEEQRRGKWRGPLHGIPIALKDNIDTKGVRTTAASQLFKDRVPAEDAEVVQRLKAVGAIIIGKLNMQEFAYGTTSVASYYGAVHNPWALDRITGGSSGGSAAAIAADLCPGTLGTDTAGSIRIPSSYCGAVGLKPTYGRVSTHGVIPLSWTLDHVGPICRTVEDAAVMLNAIAGYDERDPGSVNVPVVDYTRALNLLTSKMRLGIPRTPYYDSLDPDVQKAMDRALEVLRKLTASATDVELPPAATTPVVGPEAQAYHQKMFKDSPELYQPNTRAALERSVNLNAADYAAKLREIHVLRREIKKVFVNVDLLITPTMPGLPIPIAESQNRLAAPIRNTGPFDVFGLPTISVPCGFSTSGLPIGLQISGAPFAELQVLALAHAYEQATEWHNRRPVIRPA